MADPTPPPGPATVPPPSDPSPADARPVQRPPLRRSATDHVLGGVAGGIARALDQDVTVVRIVLVVLALAFPPTFVVYLAAWLLVARDGEPAREPVGGVALRPATGPAFWIGVAVLVVLALAALDAPLTRGVDLLPLVLVGIGVALWRRDGSGRDRAGATWPAATDQTTTTTQPWTGGAMSTTTDVAPPTAADPGGAPPGGTPPTPAAERPLPAGPPPPPPPRSPLGAMTIGIALVTTGVVAALDRATTLPLDADASHLAAVALLVLGLGQLVGALWGRARWLSIVAVFLIPPVAVGAAVREIDDAFDLDVSGFDVTDGIGERVLVPVPGETLPDELRLAAGSVTVDLADWAPSDPDDIAEDVDVVVDVGAGEVVVVVPNDVAWRVTGEVRIGEIVVSRPDGRTVDSTEDVGNALTLDQAGGPRGGEVLDIHVDVRLGQLTVVTDQPMEELS